MTTYSRPKLWWIIGLFALLPMSIGIWTWQMHIATHGAMLQIDPRHLDFGETWEQKEFAWELPIYNPSPAPIEVLQMRASCACTEVTPQQFLVPAKGLVQVRLKLDLTTKSLRNVQSSPKDFSVHLMPRTVGGGQGDGFVLRGKVKRQVMVSPSVVNFSDTVVHGFQPPSRRILIQFLTPVHNAIAKCDSAFASAVITRVADKENVFDLDVTPSLQLPRGLFEFPVTVRGESHTELLPSVSIPVYGSVVQDIHVEPAPLLFGLVPIKQGAEESITIASRTGKSFSIVGIHTDSDQIKIRPLVDGKLLNKEKLSFYEYIISVLGHDSGFGTAKIHFEVTYFDTETVTSLSVPVTWYGKSNW